MAVATNVKTMYDETLGLQKHFLKGPITVGRMLGKGAFGKVVELFIAGTRFAGKQFHDMLLGAEVSCIIQKFVEECRLMAEVKHPNIVQFMGICMLEGSEHPVLVMEYLDMSLDSLLESRQGRIPLSAKLRILLDIVRGLLYLHTHDPIIIHRDITSRNILLNRASLQAKIADLGNALMTDSKQLMNTLSKMPGTPLYMPPEASGASPKYDTSLDMFSFGHLALYVAIEIFPDDLLPATSADPITEKIVGLSEIERRQKYVDILYESEDLGKDHPLCQIIESCLSNLPNKRPNAEEALEVLEFQVNAQEDPYTSLEEACKLDLLEMAQAKGETSKSLPIVSSKQKSSSLYLHPIKARVQELKEGKPGLMEMYEKRSSLLIGFGSSMEWKQYVFIIKDQHLKYYRSNKEERVNWMEAIRPGSVAKFNLLKELKTSSGNDSDTDLGATGHKLKVFDLGMGVKSVSTDNKQKTHQIEEDKEANVYITAPVKDTEALHDNTNVPATSKQLSEKIKNESDTANDAESTSLESTDDGVYEDLDKLDFDGEQSPLATTEKTIYDTVAEELTDVPKKTNVTIHLDSLPVQSIDQDAYDLIHIPGVAHSPSHIPRTVSSPALPQRPPPTKSSKTLSLHRISSKNLSDMKAVNSSSQDEYETVEFHDVAAYHSPTLQSSASQPSRLSSLKSTSPAPGFRKRLFQLPLNTASRSQYAKSPNSPSLRPPLPPPRKQAQSPLPSKRPASQAMPMLQLPSNPSQLSSSAPSSPTTLPLDDMYIDLESAQETVEVNTSQLQQMLQNVVQEAVGKLLNADTTSDLEQSSEQQQATEKQLIFSRPTSTKNVYEVDRPRIANKSDGCTPAESRATKPVPPVPKPRTLRRNISGPQVENAQSRFRERSSSIKWLRIESDDEEDTYIPRPEWAKAATSMPSKEEDSLDVLRRQALFIPRSKIQNMKLIGRGQYGEVYKADYAREGKSSLTVAVKAVKKYQSQKAHDNFLKEMDIMSQFVHPNVVKLYGLVQQDLPWIVLEYLENGDLGMFLKRNPRPVQVLVKYMLNIAMGMHYIAEKGLVHRDIAARNIVVGSSDSTDKTETCKISDFGLLREIPKDDSIYVSKQGGPVPVRWMAPESTSRREFSTASDVWSYGVLLWEMRYPTIIPYPEIKSNMEVATQVADGFRLNIPNDYPDVVQRIIKACWQKDPSKRPSFLLISNLLSNEIDFCN